MPPEPAQVVPNSGRGRLGKGAAAESVEGLAREAGSCTPCCARSAGSARMKSKMPVSTLWCSPNVSKSHPMKTKSPHALRRFAA